MWSDEVKARLQRWAAAVTVGDGAGYPSMSVIHPNWTPPAKGSTPAMKVSSGAHDVLDTHRAIGQLSVKQRDAVCLHYVYRLSLGQHAERAGCAESAAADRLERAHRALAAIWDGGGFCNMERTG